MPIDTFVFEIIFEDLWKYSNLNYLTSTLHGSNCVYLKLSDEVLFILDKHPSRIFVYMIRDAVWGLSAVCRVASKNWSKELYFY